MLALVQLNAICEQLVPSAYWQEALLGVGLLPEAPGWPGEGQSATLLPGSAVLRYA